MSGQPQDNEAFEQAFPSADALRPYIGKVVAYDRAGTVRDAADTWDELLGRLTDEMLEGLHLLYVPGTRFVA